MLAMGLGALVWGCETANDAPPDTIGDSAGSDTDMVEDSAATHDVTPEITPPLCSTEGAGAAWTLAGLAEDGPYLAGYIDLTLRDPSRKTAAHGLYPEMDGRTLVVRVWYPADKPFGALTSAYLAPPARADGPFPMLLHSHGFSSNKDELAYAAEWMATRGWVVAAVEFPLTNLMTTGGPQLADVANQPADVRFVLDDLLARGNVSTDHLFKVIDGERVALSGVSLGGLTTLLTTYHRDWHDPRVKAAIDIAGPTGFFAPIFYSYVPLPMLLIYGDTDAIVDYTAHALPARARAPEGTRLMTLAAASHTGFAGAAALFESTDNPDSIGCSAIEGKLPDNDEFLQRMLDPVAGIEEVPLPTPCALDPLPTAMRPSRQQLLTRLAVFSWLELRLAASATKRATACSFMTTVLAAEVDVRLE